jgi:hypothetical protein
LTDTVSVLGVVPPAEERTIQGLSFDAVHLSAAPELGDPKLVLEHYAHPNHAGVIAVVEGMRVHPERGRGGDGFQRRDLLRGGRLRRGGIASFLTTGRGQGCEAEPEVLQRRGHRISRLMVD